MACVTSSLTPHQPHAVLDGDEGANVLELPDDDSSSGEEGTADADLGLLINLGCEKVIIESSDSSSAIVFLSTSGEAASGNASEALR